MKATDQPPSMDCNKLDYVGRNPGQCLAEIQDRNLASHSINLVMKRNRVPSYKTITGLILLSAFYMWVMPGGSFNPKNIGFYSCIALAGLVVFITNKILKVSGKEGLKYCDTVCFKSEIGVVTS